MTRDNGEGDHSGGKQLLQHLQSRNLQLEMVHCNATLGLFTCLSVCLYSKSPCSELQTLALVPQATELEPLSPRYRHQLSLLSRYSCPPPRVTGAQNWGLTPLRMPRHASECHLHLSQPRAKPLPLQRGICPVLPRRGTAWPAVRLPQGCSCRHVR